MANIEVINQPQGELTATVTATSLADAGDVLIFGSGRENLINVDVANSGQALTDFALLLQEHPDASFKTFLSGADWATATSNLTYAASGLNTLASGSADNFHVNIRGAHAAKFQASVASSSTALTIRYSVATSGRGR